MLRTTNSIDAAFYQPFSFLFTTCKASVHVEKAWEIWLRAVTLGRQTVDTLGAVPNEESRNVCPRPWRPEHSHGVQPEGL